MIQTRGKEGGREGGRDCNLILTRPGHHFFSPGSCQSSPGYQVTARAVDCSQNHGCCKLSPSSCIIHGKFSVPSAPHTQNLLMCYLAVSVCLKYAVLFLQIPYRRINFPLNIKYENISNIAEYVDELLFY